MASHQEQSGAILVSCQQTRFYLAEDSASREVDVKGLNITINTAGNDEATYASSGLKVKAKAKAKAKNDGLEILTSAELRLKHGIHYALVGRNGTGKSTILRALAEKLIPGIPLPTRIAILQQTHEDPAPLASGTTVLEQVVEGDPYRNHVIHQIDVLSKAMDSSDAMAPVKAYRELKHANLEKEFLEVKKMAQLRSGARGLEARKVLNTYEQKMEDSKAALEQLKSELAEDIIEQETTDAVGMLESLQLELSTMQTADVEAKARHALGGLGFKESQLTKPFSSLSGGWKMRCLLAATLVQTSDILILDEPTNYLDLLGILWLQHYLSDLKESSPDTVLLLVSHDRDFINAATTETIILRDRNLKYFAGNVSAYDKSVRHEILRMTCMKENADKQAANLEKTIVHNMRQGRKHGDDKAVKQAKSKQRKLEERMGMEVSAKGTRFKLNRDMEGFHNSARAEIEIPKLEREIAFSFPEAPDLRFPGSLVSLDKVSLKYRANPKPTLDAVDLVAHMGDKIGILGLNGSGKSTLIRLLVDELKPSSGRVARHPRLRVGYYSQHAVEQLKELAQGAADAHLTALALVLRHAASTGVDNFTEQSARALLSGLGLTSHVAAETPVAKLSGGQLVRLELARILLLKPHLLILDEPTTHLDLPTVHALTESLAGYEGAVVLVSHDRFLIRCVVEGEDVEDSSGSESEEEERGGHHGHGHRKGEEEEGKEGAGRRIVYELRNEKLMEKAGGVASWEEGLVGRLKKLGL